MEVEAIKNKTAAKHHTQFIDMEMMPSMEELLEKKPSNKNISEGAIIEGKIIEKRDSGIIVDIGFKSESFIPKEEISNWSDIKLGDKLEILLEELENAQNYHPVLSVTKAKIQRLWEKFTQTYQEGSIVKSEVKYRIRGGLIVKLMDDLTAFLPGSQIDLVPIKDMDEFIGQEIEVKIIKINVERHNVVVSRREILEADKAQKRLKLITELVPGETRKGIVKNMTDFGAFVDLNGLDGLVHITDISWKRIRHPSEILTIGQEVETVILDIDKDKKRVALGIKQRKENPWNTIEENYSINTKVKGKIVSITNYGAFVELEEGVDGLMHISEMSWTKRPARITDVFNVGDEVEAVVLSIQKDDKRLSLSLRQAGENPWILAIKKYPVGTVVKGTICSLTSYGIFVNIEEYIDGMIHVSDIHWTKKINNPADLFKVNDEIKAVVLSLDPEQQRLALGIKQLSEDPWGSISTRYKVGEEVKGLVSKLTNYGAFVTLDDEIEALLHISQLSDKGNVKLKDTLKIGEEVKAYIIKIDSVEKRIGLTLRSSSPILKKKNEVKNEDLGDEKAGEHMVQFGDIFDDALELHKNKLKEQKK